MPATASKSQIEVAPGRHTAITERLRDGRPHRPLSVYPPEFTRRGMRISPGDRQTSGRPPGAFIKRLFDSAYLKSSVAVLANGLTRVGLGQYELDNIELPFPRVRSRPFSPSSLTEKTAKIDALVAQQRLLIELLKEKRQAVISYAVTDGLNPTRRESRRVSSGSATFRHTGTSRK